MKIIAAIAREQGDVIERVLRHLSVRRVGENVCI
jgi:hypothetical protein